MDSASVTADWFRVRHETQAGPMGCFPRVLVILGVQTESGGPLEEWRYKLGTCYWLPYPTMETEVEEFGFQRKGRIKPMPRGKHVMREGENTYTFFQVFVIQFPWFPLDTLVSHNKLPF